MRMHVLLLASLATRVLTSRIATHFSDNLVVDAFDNDGLRKAVSLWLHNREEAEARWGDIFGWDTSQVTRMDALFRFSNVEPLRIGSWDTGRVTNMSYMFQGVEFSGRHTNINAWNTRSVTDMSYMFDTAVVFTPDIGAWDTSQVTDMSHMFHAALLFNKDISAWQTGQVRDMSHMFDDATLFNKDAWNTGQVANMTAMFDGVNDTCPMDAGCLGFVLRTTTGAKKMKMSVFNQDINAWDLSHVEPTTAPARSDARMTSMTTLAVLGLWMSI